MHTINWTVALVPLNLTEVLSAPQVSIGIPGLDGDGTLLTNTTLPTTLAATTTPTSDPSPTIITADPSNCDSDPEACDEAINNDPNRPPICFADDPTQADSVCIPYCQKILGSDPLVQQWGLTSTCIGAPGNLACFAVDEAIAWSEDLLKDIGKVSGMTASKWASAVLTVGSNVVAHGSKIGDSANPACPDHVFTVVDPNDMEAELGALNKC
ncbi:hypothetical protein CLAFUW4_08493 [Fulvia fulva]|uniref:Uncharacterized protein n=1 Tax=Passalora fulva TaxID=5499 RepID=A0A9Q8P764_PASFU|nr:uncharacterized protein CLAFUR5_08597 [Fulvia fulva]KAK4629123.1 hypothetical protein CLAFUR4_08498 [Fulvia fulva]KAK4630766.1 hypothetical protein CLAFUR0_08493 [Fulvia fulva]UJO15572.1 hypothetical protein CLAFUR5_08597 [Fulvia fulva]WPV12704.1 hypothetical protein CLAFUW4_08493 [Fulvia fulva]WPV27929.1 hypothetical protein CLAFUW7_08493 [Fulvia fulva]